MLKLIFALLLISVCVAQPIENDQDIFRFPLRASALVKGSVKVPNSDLIANLSGTVDFKQFSVDGGVFVTVNLNFDTPLSIDIHGIHVHTNPISHGVCNTAGGHWNPKRVTHGLLTSPIHHAGDLGNFKFSPEGSAFSQVRSMDLTLTGPETIIGRSVVVHARLDDGGFGNSPASKTSGNAGPKIACGTIVAVEGRGFAGIFLKGFKKGALETLKETILQELKNE